MIEVAETISDSKVLEGISSSMDVIKPGSSINVCGMVSLLSEIETNNSELSNEFEKYIGELEQYIKNSEEHKAPTPATVSNRLRGLIENRHTSSAPIDSLSL